MKNLTPNSLRLIPAALALVFSLLANHARATFTTWDPQGTVTTPNTHYSGSSSFYTGNLSQTWENAEWSTSQTGQASPQTWIEGNDAVFAVHTGTGTPAFTVTMNANHTVAGIFDGPETPNPCQVTISGTGTLFLTGATVGFDVTSNTSDAGSVTIDNVIAGASSQLWGEGNGSIVLNNANTYGGGFNIDGGGGVSFGNDAAFGTGTISWAVAGFIQPATTSAFNIGNAMTHLAGVTETFAGNSGGVTFSGAWTLGASGTTVTIANFNTSGYGITVSAPSAAPRALTLNTSTAYYQNPWTFTGGNTYSGGTTITAGTLTIGGSVIWAPAPLMGALFPSPASTVGRSFTTAPARRT